MCRRARPCSITGTRSASETSTAEPSQPGLCAVRAGAAGTHMCGARARLRLLKHSRRKRLSSSSCACTKCAVTWGAGARGGDRSTRCVCARACVLLCPVSSDFQKVCFSEIGTLLQYWGRGERDAGRRFFLCTYVALAHARRELSLSLCRLCAELQGVVDTERTRHASIHAPA